MVWFLIFLYALYTIYKISLDLLELSFIRAKLKEPAVVLSEEDYHKAGEVGAVNLKFNIFSHCFSFAVALIWILAGAGALQREIYDLAGDGIFAQSCFVTAFLIIGGAISLPLEIYKTFVKDRRLGFSTITPAVFVKDALKSLILTLIFGFAVASALVFCVNSLGTHWWVWGFLLSFGIVLLINLIYPTVIAPLFNKMQPLEHGELKERIEGLLQRCGFKSSGVFTIDASKRDKRLNAYFGGFGATKKVVLFDTLIEKLSEDEILAVLGHELGHFKHGDVLKNLALSFVLLGATFAVFGNLPGGVFGALGLSEGGGATLVFMILFAPILHAFFEPVISKLSRMHEFSADQHGASMQDKKSMIGALKKLGSENKAFPLAHKIYAAVYHSHPSLYERIRELDEDR